MEQKPANEKQAQSNRIYALANHQLVEESIELSCFITASVMTFSPRISRFSDLTTYLFLAESKAVHGYFSSIFFRFLYKHFCLCR